MITLFLIIILIIIVIIILVAVTYIYQVKEEGAAELEHGRLGCRIGQQQTRRSSFTSTITIASASLLIFILLFLVAAALPAGHEDAGAAGGVTSSIGKGHLIGWLVG